MRHTHHMPRRRRRRYVSDIDVFTNLLIFMCLMAIIVAGTGVVLQAIYL